jgi:hypothetical protein
MGNKNASKVEDIEIMGKLKKQQLNGQRATREPS